MRTVLTVVLCSLLAGCAADQAASGSPSTSLVVASSGAPTNEPVATSPPSRSASPAFVTKVPPAPGAAWSGIGWRMLAPEDALSQVRSIVRWRGGLIAVGAPMALGQASTTPVWVSPDGRVWQRLGPEAFGPDAMVLGIGETAAGLTALTLRGGEDACSGSESLDCWSLTEPLQAWTSSDGASWTSHPGLDGMLRPMFEGGGLGAPLFRAGTPGILVASLTDAGYRLALSRDGVDWEILPRDVLAAGFQIRDVAAFGDGFVAVGETAGDNGRAAVLTSADGRTWQAHALPTKGIGSSVGTTASSLVTGPGGLLAMGSTALTPGTSLWWSSLDARTWTRLDEYPPLGVWVGEAAGSGNIENGRVAGNGERLLAYRGDGKQAGWTSFDGRTWRKLAIAGSSANSPVATLVPNRLIVLPIGVMWVGDDSTWFGEPATR